MSKIRSIEIREINIAMHDPHSAEGYVDLFSKAYRLKRIIERGRADGFMLGAVYGAKDAVENDELHGEIYRFTHIDPEAPWFNTKTGKPAEEEDTEQIAIPQDLHPNLDQISFIFRPSSHRFWYVSKDRKASMGPSIMESFLQQLFSVTCNHFNLPPVEVTVVPDISAIDEVLKIHHLSRVKMVFKRPNDDGSEYEKQLHERMLKRKVSRIEELLVSTDLEGIQPDQQMFDQARIAANNGYVESEGFNAEGLREQESTEKKPALYAAEINESIETISHVLSRISNR